MFLKQVGIILERDAVALALRDRTDLARIQTTNVISFDF